MGANEIPPQESRFSPNVPENGVPWKIPPWMVNQNIEPGSYMNFNAQQSHHQPSLLPPLQQQQRFSIPFKRKAAADTE